MTAKEHSNGFLISVPFGAVLKQLKEIDTAKQKILSTFWPDSTHRGTIHWTRIDHGEHPHWTGNKATLTSAFTGFLLPSLFQKKRKKSLVFDWEKKILTKILDWESSKLDCIKATVLGAARGWSMRRTVVPAVVNTAGAQLKWQKTAKETGKKKIVIACRLQVIRKFVNSIKHRLLANIVHLVDFAFHDVKTEID